MAGVQLNYELDIGPNSTSLTVTPGQQVKRSLPYVQEVGDFYARERYYTRRAGLPSYLIKYVISGEGVLEYNDQSESVRPGQAFWIECQKQQYYYTSPAKKEWHMLWVHFYGHGCTRYYDLFLAQNEEKNVVTLPPNTAAPAILRELMELYKHGQSTLAGDIRAARLVTDLMSDMALSACALPEHELAPVCVQEARAYLLDHYDTRITLDDLAERYSMNKFYFQKQFKRYTGFTPNEYLIFTRLNRAKALLRTTNDTINQIAFEVGIENPSHFINLFKQREGITPHAFRQSWYKML
ncbi:Arabinose operon regulatory protein [bioreactor metagenome]|uniref:Arabinose operon regulatory protein n=1 Tax=bioreactor metagenome TaxID=1076179 RepID=A0A644Y664_9ZZZZ